MKSLFHVWFVWESQGKEGFFNLFCPHVGKRWAWHRCHSNRVPCTPHEAQLVLQSLGFFNGTYVSWCRSWAGPECSCLGSSSSHRHAVQMKCTSLITSLLPCAFTGPRVRVLYVPRLKEEPQRGKDCLVCLLLYLFHCDDSNIYTF